MTVTEFKPLVINSEEDLSSKLTEFNIKTDTWTKSVSALFKEIKDGESFLGIENGQLHRRVDVVFVKCFHTDEEGNRFQILEEKQVFKNGKVRERGFTYVAEKLQEGESPEQGALRGLAEELQISGPNVSVVALPDENKSEKRESPTYNGIQCSYNHFSFSCEIAKEYFKSSYEEFQDDKTTFFKWIKI